MAKNSSDKRRFFKKIWRKYNRSYEKIRRALRKNIIVIKAQNYGK